MGLDTRRLDKSRKQLIYKTGDRPRRDRAMNGAKQDGFFVMAMSLRGFFACNPDKNMYNYGRERRLSDGALK